MGLTVKAIGERAPVANVAVVTSSVSRNAGGLFDAVRGLVLQLPDAGISPHVFGLEDNHTLEDRAEWGAIPLTTSKPLGPKSIGFAPAMRQALLSSGAELVHTHGIWMHPSADVVAWRRRYGKPYLISPHGMLDRWILNRSKIKKWIALTGYERAHLRGAACFHALSLEEARGIRAAGFEQPIAIIPNGVHMPQTEVRTKPSWWSDNLEGKRLLLYFGRLHPKKGLDNLLLAWKATFQDGTLDPRLVLIVGGWGDQAYIDHLHQIVEARGADYQVRFIGPQFGGAKQQTYAACHGLILPSFSEGLPMVPLEAWSLGVPCALTDACNLPEGFDAGAAFRIGADVDKIKQFLVKFGAADERTLSEIGELGRMMVAERFIWRSIAERMAAVYRWLLAEGERPEWVVDGAV
ncbi:glycosyltransferase [Burkholderia sp. Bp8986]|uniref:glycosyltransferase n=1 Tax=Burkholderia sp. Bp8986 TaxID=2184550 RepID=UPI000F593004|nr:glycosyltransferase [Burkholderia sp. Bp8986]RQS48327.1 glycosyltransferase [Burkholderia sp. Bp8986]